MPAAIAAWRAGFWPAPAVYTWPIMTSLTSAGFTCARCAEMRLLELALLQLHSINMQKMCHTPQQYKGNKDITPPVHFGLRFHRADVLGASSVYP
jgi:hypothetical protein